MCIRALLGLTTSIMTLAITAPVRAQDNAATSGATTLRGQEDIIVTARRREETIQNVPVAVSVLGAAALETRGIKSEADLQLAIPGLIVRSGNNNNQLNYVIRGESVDAYSGSPPGVQPYINEVPFPVISSTPFYDVANVQAEGAAGDLVRP